MLKQPTYENLFNLTSLKLCHRCVIKCNAHMLVEFKKKISLYIQRVCKKEDDRLFGNRAKYNKSYKMVCLSFDSFHT